MNTNVSRGGEHHGWSVALAGLGINLALGVLYTWSVISKSVPASWGWSEADKSLPYSLAVLVFSLVMVPAGRFQDKLGPRLAATLGGILVGVGFVIASFTTSPLGYAVGFGLLTGAGIGFAYAAPTPAAVKWFPAAKTGMVAGVVVSGFGLASAYAAPVTRWLTLAYGIHSMMLILGIAFLLSIVILAQLLRVPQAGYVPQGESRRTGASRKKDGKSSDAKEYGAVEMLRTKQFYMIWFMYACGAGAGLMIIAKLAEIAEVQAATQLGFLLVAVLAVGNGVGRVVTGTLSDKIGRRYTLLLCFVVQAVMIVLLAVMRPGTVLATVGFLAVLSAMIGAMYGANLSLFPSVTKDFYGVKNFGINYGLVFTAYGLGGFVLALVAGRLYDVYQTFVVAYYLAAVLLVLAAIMTFFLKAPEARRA